MPLKFAVDTLDAVPEEARAFYAEKDGKYVLDVDGAVDKSKLDQFRDNNRTMYAELQELRGKFDGIDPEEARKLMDTARKQREGQLLAAGKVDEMLAERTATMKAEYEKQLKAIADERDGTRRQLEGLVVDGALRDAAMKAGVRATAVDDVLLRGRQMFRLHDGKAVPFNGDAPIYGRDGEPMKITEWVSGLAETAPHLFEPSTGSGSKGSGSTATGPGRVQRDDHAGILKNLDAIAAGKVEVV